MTFLRALETYAEPTQPFKSKLVEFAEAELILVSSTGLENKLSQSHSGLCQNLRNYYQVCRDNKDISKWTGFIEMVLEKWVFLRPLQPRTWPCSKNPLWNMRLLGELVIELQPEPIWVPCQFSDSLPTI